MRCHLSLVLWGRKGMAHLLSCTSSQIWPALTPSRTRGWVGVLDERPLFLFFVYVRSGSEALGEQRSMGMWG